MAILCNQLFKRRRRVHDFERCKKRALVLAGINADNGSLGTAFYHTSALMLVMKQPSWPEKSSNISRLHLPPVLRGKQAVEWFESG